MAALPLNVCVRKLPLDQTALAAERNFLVQCSLETLRAAVANRDLDKAFKGFRMVQSSQELEMKLSLAERGMQLLVSARKTHAPLYVSQPS